MYGDIIFVERRPLLWRSTELRRNPGSKRLDMAIYRMTKYIHYGIDLGDGKVAHFMADSFWIHQESKIVETSIEQFVKDGKLGVLNDIPYKFTREEVVERAYEVMNTNFGGYSVVENNCEHFAMWCATGIRESRQSALLRYGYFAVTYPKKRLQPISKKVLGMATGMFR